MTVARCAKSTNSLRKEKTDSFEIIPVILYSQLNDLKSSLYLHKLIILLMAQKVLGEKNLSLWQDIEGLQKKKKELDGQLHSIDEKQKILEEKMKAIEKGIGIQEERTNKLDAQLNEKQETLGKLESKIAEMELILKNPRKELVEEEPVKEEPLEEPAVEEPENQLMEVTVEASAGDSQEQQTVETREKPRKSKRWL